jgi:hypothetical protein
MFHLHALPLGIGGRRHSGWGWMNRHSNRHTSEKCKLRSKFWWLTGFCDSHDVSHFTAFFIVVGAKTSIAESVLTFILWGHSPRGVTLYLCFGVNKSHCEVDTGKKNCTRAGAHVPVQETVSRNRKRAPIFRGRRSLSSWGLCGNDPSAGSPTETLLRLHLPLNDEV